MKKEMKTRTYRKVVSRIELVRESIAETLSSPVTVVDYIRPLLEDQPQEVFLVILMDSKQKPTAVVEVSKGTLGASLVHPREVFGPVLRIGTAISIIVAHNHPSGDPTPSQEDVAITKRLKEAGNLLGVPVMDHIIIGHTTHYSFLQHGGI